MTDKVFEPLLAQFREPRNKYGVKPYVLMGYVAKTSVKPEGATHYHEEDSAFLHCLDCSNAHAQQSVIEHYARTKGFKILKYFLPIGEDARPYIGAFGERNHFLALKNLIDQLMGYQSAEVRVKEAEQHVSALEQKVRELEAKKNAKQP